LRLQLENQFGTVNQHQPRALSRHPLGNPATNPLGRTGNQRDFLLESVHFNTSVCLSVKAHNLWERACSRRGRHMQNRCN
jgi:hypothetical protein